jgi:D-alanyl-D-alanine carboxypeptidase/D-alanyl-D-alanine-endopeptidase (penicillin-binding protein 4)
MRRMRRRSLLLAGGLLLTLLSRAVLAAPTSLAERLDAAFGGEQLASASVSGLVATTGTGEVLYERDADRSLIPASNLKLATGVVALDALGAGFRYATELRADAAPNRQGWVIGDLYLRGAGDPTLTHDDLDGLAARLADRGVTRVTGTIVADALCFAGPPLGAGWSWDNETYAYSAQVSGLAVDGNVVVAEVRGGSGPGAPCDLLLDPPSGYLRLAGDCVTGEVGCKRPGVYRRRGENVVATTGPVPAGGQVRARVTLETPALYAAALFQRRLADRGVLVTGEPLCGPTPDATVALAEHLSPPLSDILVMMNKPSDNNVAEALLRTIPRLAGQAGTAEAGVAIVEERLAQWGIDPGRLRICDGSGLSRYSLLTARSFVALLRHAARDPRLAGPIAASLPIAGVDGTLTRRMRGTAAEGAIHAKTGSLRGVSTLSGYVDGERERILTFSFLVNNYTCSASVVRGIQDRACEVLAEYAAH